VPKRSGNSVNGVRGQTDHAASRKLFRRPLDSMRGAALKNDGVLASLVKLVLHRVIETAIGWRIGFIHFRALEERFDLLGK
jgi:hypothetical protein